MRENICVGSLTASASHELQNALAVIRESAGLMQDIFALAGDTLPRRERVTELLATIQQQVVRGGEIAGGLNGLGHAWEEDGSDLRRVLEEFVILAGRMGRMHGIAVGLTYGDGRVRAPHAGLALRVALFDVLRSCLQYAPGCSITFAPALRTGLAGIALRLDMPTANLEPGALAMLEKGFHNAGMNRIEDAHNEVDLQQSNAKHYFMPCQQDSCIEA